MEDTSQVAATTTDTRTQAAPRAPRSSNVSLTCKVPPDLVARLDTLVAGVPFCTRHRVHQMAMRIGLEAIERDPDRIVKERHVR